MSRFTLGCFLMLIILHRGSKALADTRLLFCQSVCVDLARKVIYHRETFMGFDRFFSTTGPRGYFRWAVKTNTFHSTISVLVTF